MLNFFKEGISKNIISLLLCVSIVTSCMYVYAAKYLALFIILTFLIQASVFSFYTFLSKKSMLLKFVSVLGSFAAICAMVTIALKTGNDKSSIDFFIWFLSPQALVEFSLPYIIATFIVINFFIASTVYYFSAVRYRISMTFLITLIPFAFYRKEGEQVPVFFALLLLVMYIALMIHCRQLNTKPNQKLIIENGYKKSMIMFLALSVFFSIIIPKPDIKIDNSWVDYVFESQKITDYMLARLGLVSEKASSSVAYTQSSNIKLYEFIADEHPINLKSQTYSNYDYKNNLWSAGEDELSGSQTSMSNAVYLNPAEFYAAVMKAAEYDNDFSEKYDLNLKNKELKSDYIHKLTLVYSRIYAKYYYTPVNSFEVFSPLKNKIYRSDNGMLFADVSSGNYYSLNYYSDASAYDNDFNKLIKKFDFESFGDFLNDMKIILEENGPCEKMEVVNAYYDEYFRSKKYFEQYDTNDIPDSIKELADSITQRYSSDLEKALAIQSYFSLNDYVYDLTYRKPDGYNMEYFLNTGKTGICSDYATAMVLLSRLSGIPARYAEGIHLHDPDENGIIAVMDSDLHAFPELYIAGYGWMSFEPTQLSVTGGKSNFDFVLSVVLISLAVLLILFVILWEKFLGAFFSEYIFRMRIKKASNEKIIILITERIRKILKTEKSMTSGELAEYVQEIYNIKIEDISEAYDSIVFGENTVSSDLCAEAEKIYSELREIMKKTKKSIPVDAN